MKKLFDTKDLAIIGIFAAATAILSQIAVPLPFTPVPVSLGVVAVYVAGILLKPKRAFFAQACYLAIGAAGMPVFGNFRGGVAALFGPTGGYLIVYPLMAWIVALALNGTEKSGRRVLVFVRAGAAMCAAHILLYACGTAWLSATSGLSYQAALAMAVYPFIPLDIAKIVFCAFAVVPIRSRVLFIDNMIIK